MVTRILNVLLRLALLTALAAAAAMYVDYQSPTDALFCGVQSGCAQVRDSAYSSIAGVSMPTFGVGVFAGLFALAIGSSSRRHFRNLALLTVMTALAAAALIVLQLFFIGAVCTWCMVVDSAAIIAAVLAVWIARRPPDHEPRWLRQLWAAAGVAALVLPLIWSSVVRADLPGPIAELQSDDKVDIVMFTDFQCPFCRRLHGVVHEAMTRHPGRVRLQRLMVPLAGHSGAGPAALAYLCVPQDQRQALADKLYAAGVAQLTPDGVAKMAGALGVESSPFWRCVRSKETEAKIAAHTQLFTQAKLRGLPSTYVEAQLVTGADAAAFEQALAHALGGGGKSASTWLLGAFGLLLMAAIGLGFAQARGSR